MNNGKTLTAMLTVLAMTSFACSKKEEGAEKTEGPAAKKTTTDTRPAAAATTTDNQKDQPAKGEPAKENPAASDIAIDEEVMAEIKAIASKCEFNDRGSYSCKNDEDKKLFQELYGYGDGAKDRVATIGTAAVAMADTDVKVQVVAAKLLSSKFSQGWGTNVAVGQVDKAISAKMREALPKLGMYQQRGAIAATIYASSLSDSDAEAHAFLEGLDDEYARNKGWASSMFYGRMKAFEKVKGLAATGDPKQILVALQAGNGMPEYTDDEKAELCPWAHGFLGADPEDAKESDIFEQAGYILTRCSGEWVDKLLDWGEAERAKNHFDRKYYFVYRELCHSVMKGVVKVGATPEQCERNWTFLEKTANTKGIEPQFRAWALDSISYSRRDEKSYKLMKKYEKSKVPEIKKVAEDALKMLEGYVKKK